MMQLMVPRYALPRNSTELAWMPQLPTLLAMSRPPTNLTESDTTTCANGASTVGPKPTSLPTSPPTSSTVPAPLNTASVRPLSSSTVLKSLTLKDAPTSLWQLVENQSSSDLPRVSVPGFGSYVPPWSITMTRWPPASNPDLAVAANCSNALQSNSFPEMIPGPKSIFTGGAVCPPSSAANWLTIEWQLLACEGWEQIRLASPGVPSVSTPPTTMPS